MKTMKKIKCKTCDKEISYSSFHYGSGLCHSCAMKGKKRKPHTQETKDKIRNTLTKHGRCRKDVKHFCIDCGKQITIGSKSGKCHSCVRKPKIYKCKSCNEIITGRGKTGLCSSCSKIDKKRSETACENMSKVKKGKNHPMWGKHHKKESLKKMSLTKGGTGNPYENYDLDFAIRRLSEYNNWRLEIFNKDNHTCQECGKSNCYLEAHHLKEFSAILKEFLNLYSNYSPIEDRTILLHLASKYKPFWKLKNGKTLCKDCHKLTDNYAGNIKRGE
jgi:hypothetical protein